jgi:hypothetical protein
LAQPRATQNASIDATLRIDLRYLKHWPPAARVVKASSEIEHRIARATFPKDPSVIPSQVSTEVVVVGANLSVRSSPQRDAVDRRRDMASDSSLRISLFDTVVIGDRNRMISELKATISDLTLLKHCVP